MKLYEKLVYILLIWTVIQDIFLALMLNVIGSVMIVKILFFSKDVLFIVLFLWALCKQKIKSKYFIAFSIYFALILIHSINSFLFKNIGLMSLLSAIRGWLLMPGFMLIGYFIKDKKYFLKKLLFFFGKFMVIISAIGIIEFLIDSYVASTIPFWTNFINIGNYMDKIKGQSDRLVYGLPGNFYGQYGGEFFSQKRLVSLWGGPLTAAYVLCIPCILYLIKMNKSKKIYLRYFIYFCIVFLAIVFTFTRAIILQIFVVIAIYEFVKNKYFRKMSIILLPIFFIVIIMSFDKLISYVYDGSTIEHLNQFLTSFKNASIFGEGIGTYGVGTSNGTESAYVSCYGQIGLLGVVIYIFGHIVPLSIIYKKYKTTHNQLYILVLLSGTMMLITGFISEQLLAYTSIAPYYVLLGFALGYPINFEENEYLKSI